MKDLGTRLNDVTIGGFTAIGQAVTNMADQEGAYELTKRSVNCGVLELTKQLGFDTSNRRAQVASVKLGDAIYKYIESLRKLAEDEDAE